MSVSICICIQTETSLQDLVTALLSASDYELLRPPCKTEEGIEFWTTTNVALFVCDNDLVNDGDADFENYNRLILVQAYRNDLENRVDTCTAVGHAAFQHLVAKYDAPTLMTFGIGPVIERHVPSGIGKLASVQF